MLDHTRGVTIVYYVRRQSRGPHGQHKTLALSISVNHYWVISWSCHLYIIVYSGTSDSRLSEILSTVELG